MRSYPVEVEGGESRVIEARGPAQAAFVSARGLSDGSVVRVTDASGWRRVYRIERRRPQGVRLEPPEGLVR